MKFPLTDKQIDEILNNDAFDCMDAEDYQCLYEYYLPDMPYGTAKARTGDPDQWIFHQMEKDFAHMIK